MVINVISLFAGIGGSSLGYWLAGCKISLACDWEKKALDIYGLNFPTTKTILGDIRQLTGKKIEKLIGIEKGKLDILDASPPCTPFSLAGKREKSWNKSYRHVGDTKKQTSNDLFFEFIRLVDELRPKTFIAENVKGLIIGKAKGYAKIIKQKLIDLGYNVEIFLLDAKHFGVAQSRERIFFIGIRKDIRINANAKLKTFPIITFRQATRNLVNSIEELKQAQCIDNKSTITNKVLCLIQEGKSRYDIDPKNVCYNSIRLNYDLPCPTMTTKDCYYHPIENRKITLLEAKRLSSFPDTFEFPNISEAKKRIGNCVPPNLIKNVALYVIEKANLFNNILDR